MATSIQDTYKYVKNAPFASNVQKIAGSNVTTEVVDIIRDYPWAGRILKNNSGYSSGNFFGSNVQLGTSVSGHSISHNFPYCYCVEREQTISSSFANFVSTLAQANDAMRNGGKIIDDVGLRKAWDEMKGKLSEYWEKAVDAAGKENTEAVDKALDSIVNVGKSVASDSMNQSVLLQPYSYVYSTTSTGKFFVFPLLSDTDLFKLTSQWSDTPDNGNSSILLNAALGKSSFLSTATQEVNMVSNLINFVAGDKSNANKNYHIDQGKFYNYPTEGEDIEVSFPLYNTSAKGAWKQNFRFLFLFAARNLPTKMSISEFKVPLLYDIIIPGHKRLPICYVSNFAVQPLGLIRTMPCESLLPEVNSGSWNVPIPEAWEIRITFKCLIPPSLNLMVSAMADDRIKIT